MEKFFTALDKVAWVTESPFKWPTIPRRIFLLTLPISLPLWIVVGTAAALAMLVFALTVIVCGLAYGSILWLWTGEKPGWFEFV